MFERMSHPQISSQYNAQVIVLQGSVGVGAMVGRLVGVAVVGSVVTQFPSRSLRSACEVMYPVLHRLSSRSHPQSSSHCRAHVYLLHGSVTVVVDRVIVVVLTVVTVLVVDVDVLVVDVPVTVVAVAVVVPVAVVVLDSVDVVRVTDVVDVEEDDTVLPVNDVDVVAVAVVVEDVSLVVVAVAVVGVDEVLVTEEVVTVLHTCWSSDSTTTEVF